MKEDHYNLYCYYPSPRDGLSAMKHSEHDTLAEARACAHHDLPNQLWCITKETIASLSPNFAIKSDHMIEELRNAYQAQD